MLQVIETTKVTGNDFNEVENERASRKTVVKDVVDIVNFLKKSHKYVLTKQARMGTKFVLKADISKRASQVQIDTTQSTYYINLQHSKFPENRLEEYLTKFDNAELKTFKDNSQSFRLRTKFTFEDNETLQSVLEYISKYYDSENKREPAKKKASKKAKSSK